MNRRQLLLGLLTAGAGLEAQEPPAGSLYIPQPHQVDDRKFLHDFMDEYAFADLVTAAPDIRITHIPVLLERGAGYGTLFGHVSRHNPQHEAFDGKHPAVVVFRGPDSYISPRWYSKAEAVPTWNFAVVHAGGRPQAISDAAELHALLARLIAKFEGADSSYDFGKLPDNFVNGLASGIVGFRMPVERLEGKFKLGQERSAADREAILKHLETATGPRSMHDFTAAFYKRG